MQGSSADATSLWICRTENVFMICYNTLMNNILWKLYRLCLIYNVYDNAKANMCQCASFNNLILLGLRGKFWKGLKCFEMFWKGLTGFERVWNVLIGFGRDWQVWSLEMFGKVLKYLWRCWKDLKCFEVFWSVLKGFEWFERVWKVLKGLERFWKALKVLKGFEFQSLKGFERS